MHNVWTDDSPHARFWRKLLNQRFEQLQRSRAELRKLRFDYKQFKWVQKRMGAILEERGLNLFQMVAEAYDENWDSEDEEKTAKKSAPSPLKEEQHAVRVDHTCQGGLRSRAKEGRELQVQNRDDGREEDVQEKGSGGCRLGGAGSGPSSAS